LQIVQILERAEWKAFLSKRIGRIEVLDGEETLQRIFFVIPEVCTLLPKQKKLDLMLEVKRDSSAEKLNDLISRVPDLEHEINHQANIYRSNFAYIATMYPAWTNALFFLVFTINLLIISYYEVDPITGDISIAFPLARISLSFLSLVHLLFSTVLLISYIWCSADMIIYYQRKKSGSVLLKNNRKKAISEGYFSVETMKKLFFLFSDGWVLYHIVYLMVSFAGNFYPQFFVFHLLDICLRSVTVRNVLKSVTLNGHSILLTALLVMIVIYVYAVIGFFVFRDAYKVVGLSCETLYECLLTTIHFGIRSGGGIGDVLLKPDFHSSEYLGRMIYDVSFFAVIIVILLNIVFGIILDTFGELREKRNAIEEDIRTRCFICNVESDELQRFGVSFSSHIKHEHNMWNYVYYFIYLDNKERDDYTSIENFISAKREGGSIDYFPVNKAISISR